MNSTRNFVVITLMSILLSLGVGYNVGMHRCRSQPATSLSQAVSSAPSLPRESEPMVSVAECSTRMSQLGATCVNDIHKVDNACTAKIHQLENVVRASGQTWEMDTYSYDHSYYPLEDCYGGIDKGNANCYPRPYAGTTLGNPSHHRRHAGER